MRNLKPVAALVALATLPAMAPAADDVAASARRTAGDEE